jgi:serine/threonine protein kinase/tetratricopeptide (TPR) repeat protein
MTDYPPAVTNLTAGALTGSTVGRFLIGDCLGKGAMGEVYRADDPRLKRTVAIKRLSPALRADPLYRRRFLDEAERASSFNDAHVAAVYDVVEDRDEIFLVMELVEGQTLRQRLREKMTLEEFLGIASQSAEALVAAHERGIVHCDIKPENIMLTNSGQVKILDFGVAKHLPSSDQSSTIDRSGVVGGTPAYMAPEVLLEGIPDGRADIFSLGVVLYEALTGKHPFAAGSYVATTHRVLHEKPAPIRIFNSKVPEALEETVNRALAKQAADRYQTARQLLEDLEAVQAGVGSTKLLPRPQKKLSWTLRLTVGLALVLAIASVTYANWARLERWLGLTPPPLMAQMKLAVLPFSPPADDPSSRAFAQGLTETVAIGLTKLTASYPVQIVSPREMSENSVQTPEQARRLFGVNLVLEGSLRESGQQVRVSYSIVDAATRSSSSGDILTVDKRKPFEIEDRVLQSIVSNLGLQLQPAEKTALMAHGTTEPAAYDYYLRGRGYLQDYHKPENVESAITVLNHALEKDPNYALAFAELGEAYLYKYDQTRKSDWVDKALVECNRAVSLASSLADGHICLGHVYNNTGRYENAVEELDKAVQLDVTNDEGFRALALAYQRLGKMKEAEDTYIRAVRLRPQYWAGYEWLGSFYAAQSRYDDAARNFTEVIALAPDSYLGYSNLGAIYLYQGRYAEAIPQFQRSVTIYPNLEAYSNLATAYFLQGSFEDAAHAYERGVDVGANDTLAYVGWGNLADAYYWAPGHRNRAPAAYQKAISLARERLDVNPRDADAIYHLAIYYAMLGEKQRALDYSQRAMQLRPDNGDVLLNVAKVHALLGDEAKSVKLLQQALADGIPVVLVRDDPTFKNLAANVQFQELIQKN